MANPTGINQYSKGGGMLGKSAASRRKAFNKNPREFMTGYKNERNNFGTSRAKALKLTAIRTSLFAARNKGSK